MTMNVYTFRCVSYCIQYTYNSSRNSTHTSRSGLVQFDLVWFDSVRFVPFRLIIVATYSNSPTTTYRSIYQVMQSIRVLIQLYFDILFQQLLIRSKEQIWNIFMKSLKNRAINRFTDNTHTHSNTNKPTTYIIMYCISTDHYIALCILLLFSNTLNHVLFNEFSWFTALFACIRTPATVKPRK